MKRVFAAFLPALAIAGCGQSNWSYFFRAASGELPGEVDASVDNGEARFTLFCMLGDRLHASVRTRHRLVPVGFEKGGPVAEVTYRFDDGPSLRARGTMSDDRLFFMTYDDGRYYDQDLVSDIGKHKKLTIRATAEGVKPAEWSWNVEGADKIGDRMERDCAK